MGSATLSRSYLRWSSKEALLTDAVTLRLARVADVDTGTLHGDLVELATQMLDIYAGDTGRAALRLGLESRRHPRRGGALRGDAARPNPRRPGHRPPRHRPRGNRFLGDGDRLPMPGRDVRAIWTPGHTPGHLCLHDAAAGILLTGDHLLPRISPNIGVDVGREGDPLTAYLASLDAVTGFRADEALPAHEYRFRGIDIRAADLIAHHHARNTEILGAIDDLAQPTAWAIAAQLTWSRGWAALHGMMRRMALAETVAHLRHLVTAGDVAGGGGPPLMWRRSPA